MNLTVLVIFYANYITRDGSKVLANLTIWCFYIYITRDGSNVLANLTILQVIIITRIIIGNLAVFFSFFSFVVF